MTTKVRIKVGSIEVDYEGSEDFLSLKLPKLISDVTLLRSKLLPKVPVVIQTGIRKANIKHLGKRDIRPLGIISER